MPQLKIINFVILAVPMIVCFKYSKGFLIDGNTMQPQTPGSVMTDEHYNFVLEFLYQERKSRLQLETRVSQLQQHLTAAHIDLSAKVDAIKHCGCADTDQGNKTSILENKIERLQTNYQALAAKYALLQDEHLITTNKSAQLENEITELKKLKLIADMRLMLEIQNETSNLGQQVKETKDRQTALESDANARKEDFIALYNKVHMIETTTTNTDEEIIKNISTFTDITSNKIKNYESKFLNRIQTLESTVNSSMSISEKQLSDISNRALLSAWTSGGSLSPNEVVPFKSVITSHGINNLSSVMNEGKFRCEKSGYYLIAAFVTFNTDTRIYIYKNSEILAAMMKSPTTYYQTHTAIVFSHLLVNDMVYAKVANAMTIVSTYDSMFSVMQVA